MIVQTVVETPEFIRRAAAVGIGPKEREVIVEVLACEPEAGVALGGGLRKVRIARSGGGKSGGYRVIFLYRRSDLPLFLLTVFAKSEKANLSPAELNTLVDLCDLIADSYGKPR